MNDEQPPVYRDGFDVQRAILKVTRRAAPKLGRTTPTERFDQAYRDRLLSRVFDQEDAPWLLKGGTAMLARVADGRGTRDVDLHHELDVTIDEAVADLVARVNVDIGDHLLFEHINTVSMVTNGQPYRDGVTLTFACVVDGKRGAMVKVDVVVAPKPIGVVPLATPANRLDVPGLPASDYRLFPTEQQIAEKLCASQQTFGGEPSSREKDLVDLVILAKRVPIDPRLLRLAIATECRRRSMTVPETFEVPSTWGRAYSAEAARTAHCDGLQNVADAAAFVGTFLDPILASSESGKWDGMTWRDPTR